MSQALFHNLTGQRRVRSERLDAVEAVLKVFLAHLEFTTRCIGVTAPDNCFVGLDIKTIAQKSGLGRRRCERAIANLKEMGLIEVYPPRQHNLASPSIKYSRSRAVRAISPSFFEYLTQNGFLIKSEPGQVISEGLA